MRKVGAVTGLVGAAGGLGGFLPPLVMGAVYGVDVALAAAGYTGHGWRAWRARKPVASPAVASRGTAAAQPVTPQ